MALFNHPISSDISKYAVKSMLEIIRELEELKFEINKEFKKSVLPARHEFKDIKSDPDILANILLRILYSTTNRVIVLATRENTNTCPNNYYSIVTALQESLKKQRATNDEAGLLQILQALYNGIRDYDSVVFKDWTARDLIGILNKDIAIVWIREIIDELYA